MSRRKIEPGNEANPKSKKPFLNRENDSILNVSLNEHLLLPATIKNKLFLPGHNPTTISACAWNQDGNASIQEELNMGGDGGASTSNFNHNAEERRKILSNKESCFDERTVDRSVSNRIHIDELPPELLIDIFDFLSMKDLSVIRRTSKRWRQIGGYCFQRSYSPIKIQVSSWRYKNWSAFSQLIRRIGVSRHANLLQQIIDTNSIFHHVRIVRLSMIDLTGLRIDPGNEFFSNIEHLDIFYCKMDANSADRILTSSTNLKRLTLCQEDIIGNEWFDRKYPSLEVCAFIRRERDTPMHDMPIAILVNNPNIREFGINCDALLRQAQLMRTTTVKLDMLHVHITYVTEGMESSTIRVLLNELYELRVFKRLHLYIDHFDRFMTDNDLALLLGLKKLYMHYGNVSGDWDDLNEIEPFQLKPLQSLDELSVDISLHIKDIEAAATNLQNLERFYATIANFSHIVLFIKKLRKLREIAVLDFDTVEYYKNSDEPFVDYFEFGKKSEKSPNFIDLYMLNSERAKLPNAQKVTLYVGEELYFATKLAIKDTINLEFIRLKRIESFQMYYGLFH